MGEMEQQLKEDIKNLNAARIKLEDNLQEEKQKVFQVEIAKRQREIELENVVRDNRSLKGTIDIMQQSAIDLANENYQLKELQSENERGKLQLKVQFEKSEREIKKLQSELKRSQMLLQEAQD